MKKAITFAVFLLTNLAAMPQQPRVIFDSDMGPDYDDVGAITLLHKFADEGRIRILATVASTKYAGVACVLNVFNTYFRRPGIPVGVPKGNALVLRDWQHWTDSVIRNYPHRITGNSDVPDAVSLYREILSAQPDKSVTIITVGFLTNLRNLLLSPPDSVSPLPGDQLVARKVKKLVSMGGKFPSGSEFNLNRDPVSSKYVYEHWPSPVIFSGFEIGEKILCGLPLIHDTGILHNPVKDVFRICIPLAKEDANGRKSWDETAVLVAVMGYRKWFSLQKGTIVINPDGSNSWKPDPAGRQAYLVEKVPPVILQQLIDRCIRHRPGGP